MKSTMNETNRVKWTVQDVFVVFISVFVLELMLFVTLNFFGFKEFVGQFEANPYIKSSLVFGTLLLQVIAMLLPLWVFILRKYKSGLKEFSFIWPGTKKTVLWVIGSYLFYLGLGSLIITLFVFFSIGQFGFEPPMSIFAIFGRDLFSVILAFIFAIIIAPLAEEVFFRGFVLKALDAKIGTAWGIVITTLIFALVHFEFRSIIPLLILSLILNILFVKTKSIWPGIIFHVMNNMISFFVIYYLENNGIFL